MRSMVLMSSIGKLVIGRQGARRLRGLVLAAGVGLLGCGPGGNTPTQPGGISLSSAQQQPLVGTLASAPAQLPYSPPASADQTGDTTADVSVDGDGTGTAPSVDPNATADPNGFHEHFEGSALDPAHWVALPQGGVLNVGDGQLDMFVTAPARSFPYIVTRNPVVPATGPFYVEWVYAVPTSGSGQTTFGLDALPPMGVGDAVSATHTFNTQWRYSSIVCYVEGQEVGLAAKAFNTPGFHDMRVEVDADNNLRVIFDHGQVAVARTIKKRPTRFFVGGYPLLKSSDKALPWPRVQLKSVDAGVLDKPDPATPPPAPSPTPTHVVPTPTPRPTARPTTTPTSTVTPSQAPASPTPTPSQAASQAPSPGPSPSPTPSPSPSPTPTDSPTPADSPTPTPTPSPSAASGGS